MKNFIILIFVFFFYRSYSQNLIPNGDFEQHYSCDLGPHSIDSCYYWHSPTTNIQGVSGTPDYYNQCSINGSLSVPENWFGFQYAHSGSAYAGIYLGIGGNYREYIESILSQPLVSGLCYHFEMYLNLSNICRLSTDDIQVYFSDSAVTGINNWDPLPFVPQVENITGNYFDTLNWKLVSGDYTAHGGETNIIIGNFKVDSLTDSLVVNWGAVVSSTIYVYIDDVSLSVCTGINENEHSEKETEIYPNPVHDAIKIRSTVNFKAAEFALFDAAGSKVMHKYISRQTTFSAKELKQGVYFYEIKDTNGKTVRGKVIKE